MKPVSAIRQWWRLVVGCLNVAQLVIGQSTQNVSPIELTEMTITSTISTRYAYTEVITHVRNPTEQVQETTCKLLLPENAFISGFAMILDNKEYKAYVKEKEEAKKIYNKAVEEGLSAATVTAKVRDSNRFMVSVNVKPKSIAIFNLTYEELLVRRNGVYNHAINLHPGGLVSKFTVNVHIRETKRLTKIRVPEIKTGIEFDVDENDLEYSEPIITRYRDEGHATITFKPDLNEQKRLMAVYDHKIRESLKNKANMYLRNQIPVTEGVLGQFVIQYDVDRQEEGETVVNNKYFAQFLSAPSSTPVLSKYVVFVLDTSESMIGTKITQLKQAMEVILGQLNKGDFFSIVEFASAVLVHELNEAKLYRQPSTIDVWVSEDPVTLVTPSQVTPENIANAQTIIRRLEAVGGTNIAEALDAAIQLINKSVDSKEYNVNDDLKKIVIFLTDGQPTVGEESTEIIITDFIKKNDGGKKTSLYTLGFGEDTDGDFLRKLALSNNGFTRHIYEASDAAVQLNNFFSQVSDPVYSDVSVSYQACQVISESLTKTTFPTIFDGGEEVVAGRLAENATQLTPKLGLYTAGEEKGLVRKRVEKQLYPKARFVREDEYQLPLKRLWAYLTIKQLLNERDIAEFHDKALKDSENAPEKKALKLALKYGFVTPLTSLVVVKPEEKTTVVNADSSYDDKEQTLDTGKVLITADLAPIVTSQQKDTLGIDEGTDEYNITNMSGLPFKPLDSYKLGEYAWALPLLDLFNERIKIRINGIVNDLFLYRKYEDPWVSVNPSECVRSIAGGPGLCVYLTQCEAAKNITADLYLNTYCDFGNGYAGVCCPRDFIEKKMNNTVAKNLK